MEEEAFISSNITGVDVAIRDEHRSPTTKRRSDSDQGGRSSQSRPSRSHCRCTQVKTYTMYSNNLQITKGTLIPSASSDYEVQCFLGAGSFGAVTQCRKVATNETVALKILKSSSSIQEGRKEEAILKYLKLLGSESFNIVMWKNSFCYNAFYCLEFEKLDITLFEFVGRLRKRALTLMGIRPIVQQLAKALDFLKRAGVVHADLKLDNIMMVDHLHQPLRIKVIDFGLAVKNPAAYVGRTLQPLWYRSPEVLLGASFNEAIEVWSLGCIAVELFMGIPLFRCPEEYDLMRRILSTIGKPPDRMLNTGLNTSLFFKRRQGRGGPKPWRFKSMAEVGCFNGGMEPISCLEDLNKRGWKVIGEEADADNCDRKIFLQLIGQMLKLDPSERIEPIQILQHPFITMSHLVEPFKDSPHVKFCVEHMQNLQRDIICHGDEAQVSLSTRPAEGSPIEGQSDGRKKRRRDPDDDDDDDDDDDNCKSLPKRQKVEVPDAATTSPGRQMKPLMSRERKRSRDDADPGRSSEGNPPSKKRRGRNLE